MFYFLSRVTDVSIGTIRVILLTREKKGIAASLGFLEVLLWVVVITQVIKNLNNVFCYLAYAGGFATGTFIGMILEEKLAIGFSLLRIISPQNGSEIADKLSEAGYRVTIMNGHGSRGPVKIVFTVLKEKNRSGNEDRSKRGTGRILFDRKRPKDQYDHIRRFSRTSQKRNPGKNPKN